mmetsp:Transcript_18164/g.39470  ORF Transcript_18164/g.39470 Transcript_18164/m.39470 type:complete len:113 (-) Transcript_18164:168-506(-)
MSRGFPLDWFLVRGLRCAFDVSVGVSGHTRARFASVLFLAKFACFLHKAFPFRKIVVVPIPARKLRSPLSVGTPFCSRVRFVPARNRSFRVRFVGVSVLLGIFIFISFNPIP